jgi:hypothetical protein
MLVRRIRRTPRGAEDPQCRCCDGPVQTGYEFLGIGCGARGCVGTVAVCDGCLNAARKSTTGMTGDADADDESE